MYRYDRNGKLDYAVRFAAYPIIQSDHDTTRNKGNAMPQSTIYKELEAMIEKNWLVKSLSEFNKQLEQLEKDRQITIGEYRSLLELYIGKSKKIN